MPPALKSPPSSPEAAISADDKTLRNLKRLIWLYFWLLIFEGSFRKWVLPQFSDILLVIRDPVAIAIYFLAFRHRVFPRNAYIVSLALIALLSWLVALLVLHAVSRSQTGPPGQRLWVSLQLPAPAAHLHHRQSLHGRGREKVRLVGFGSGWFRWRS